MYINSININNDFSYINTFYNSSLIRFGRKKKADETDSFLKSENNSDNNKNDKKQLVINLKLSGLPIKKIAQEVNLTREEIIQILNQYFLEEKQKSINTKETTKNFYANKSGEVDFSTRQKKKQKQTFENDDDINLEKVLSSTYLKILQYNDQVKQEVSEIMIQPFACEYDLEIKILNLNRIRQEVINKSLEYAENKKENSILQSLLRHIDTKIKNVSTQIKKIEKKKGSSSLPNVTWLTQEDFKNKLLGHQRFINISKIANCEMSEIEKANNNLKKAYPEECVIWIDQNNYDTQNTNNPNKQKYTVFGRFYEALDGKKYGQFGTKKLFVIEFFSDAKNTYENFINSLIKNKTKIVGS